MDNGAIIQVKDLTKRYGKFTALDRVTMNVEAGHILGLIGPNGAGKTTLINILVGLLEPNAGSATVAGADCAHDLRRVRQNVGYMPDLFGLYSKMRVHEYLDFFCAAFNVPTAKRRQSIERALELTGAAHMRNKFLASLSHGMKQHIALSRTLLHDPPVLILDEPHHGLDPIGRIEMRQLMLKLAKMGKTLLITSHILPELAQICDVVAILTAGRLRAFGTLAEIMRQVNQRRTIEVQLLSEDSVEPAAALIRRQLGDEAEVTASHAEAIVRFTTNQDNVTTSALLSELTAQRLGVSQFGEIAYDLEDAFLSVTGQQANDAATTAAR